MDGIGPLFHYSYKTRWIRLELISGYCWGSVKFHIWDRTITNNK